MAEDNNQKSGGRDGSSSTKSSGGQRSGGGRGKGRGRNNRRGKGSQKRGDAGGEQSSHRRDSGSKNKRGSGQQNQKKNASGGSGNKRNRNRRRRGKGGGAGGSQDPKKPMGRVIEELEQLRHGVLFFDTHAQAKNSLANIAEKSAEVDILNVVIKAEGSMDDPEILEHARMFAGEAWHLIHSRRQEDGFYNEMQPRPHGTDLRKSPESVEGEGVDAEIQTPSEPADGDSAPV